MDITQIILDQHGGQRWLFGVLEDYPKDDQDGLGALWHQLENFLLLHAEAEELYFYPELVKIGTGGGDAPSEAEEVTDAIKDHNELREAIRRVRKAKVGSTAWWTAVEDATVANSDHMAEEERQDLADFRQQASLELRHTVAVAFLRHEALHWEDESKPAADRDPEAFVEEKSDAPESPRAKSAAKLEAKATPTRASRRPARSKKSTHKPSSGD